MSDLSIVIVSYNAREYLIRCLQSILPERSTCDLQVIVVDNASSDGSPDAAIQAAPWVTLIRNGSNLGFATANNIGIRLCDGRHICLMNSDIEVSAGSLAELVAYLDTHPKVGMVAPRILNPDGTLQPSCRRFPSYRGLLSRTFALDKILPNAAFLAGSFMTPSEHDAERGVEVASGCFCVARAEALRDVGLLDEDFFIYSEDIDWCRRFHSSGWPVIYYPQAQAIHHGGASSDSAPVRFFIEKQKADLLYWRKHHGPLGAFCCAVAIGVRESFRAVARGIECVVLPARRAVAGPKLRRSIACLRWLLIPQRADTAARQGR